MYLLRTLLFNLAESKWHPGFNPDGFSLHELHSPVDIYKLNDKETLEVANKIVSDNTHLRFQELWNVWVFPIISGIHLSSKTQSYAG